MRTIILSDLRQGTKKNIFKFIIAGLFCIVSVINLKQMVGVKAAYGSVNSDHISFADGLIYIMGGMVRYVESSINPFSIPINWMTVQLIVTSCIFLYPVKDMFDRGKNVLLLYGSRTKWWISKCIWAIVQVFIVFACMWGGTAIAILCVSGDFKSVSFDIMREILDVTFINENVATIVICIFLMPLLYCLTTTIVQINLSLYFGPIVSTIAVLIYQILSAYTQSALLLGNYSMILRTEKLVAGGLPLLQGVLMEIAVSIIAILAGTLYMKKKDILNKMN